MDCKSVALGWILTVAGCAIAQTVPVAPPPANVPVIEMSGQALSPDTPVEQTLDALDQVGRGLKDFDANVSMGQADDVTGEDTKRTGKVSLQRSDDNARVHVLFDKRIVGKRVQDKKVEYLLADGWLTDRNYDDKVEIRRQVTKPGEKVDLLKLGDGPFPLPIGQKREDVQKTFDVTKVAPSVKNDPPGTVHLTLTPKRESSFARKFKAIDVWVESKTHFPVRIQTLDKNETTLRTTDLSKIRVNPGLKDGDFELPKIGSDWQSTQEKYAE